MPESFASRITDQVGAIQPVVAKTAIFISRNGFKALVNTGESSVVLPFVGMHLPPSGHPVQLELRAGQMVVTGPARPLPGIGKITATGSPKATVAAWGVSYVLAYRAGYTPVVDDDVEISWSGDEGVIQGKVTAVTVAVPPPVLAPPGTTLFHPPPFLAIDSGTWNPSYSKWITRDVWASLSTTGAWFHGNTVKDTIPDSAVVKLARIFLPPLSLTGGAPILQRHTSPTKPGSPVTFIGAGVALGSRSGWVDFPLSWVDYLKANPGGIGMNHGGFNKYRGTQSDGLSGALDISWEA